MKKRYLVCIIPFILIVLITTLSFFFSKPLKYSETERRLLKQIPDLKIETLVSGKYMKDFDDYTLDQFPMRDRFRKLKVWVCKNILQQNDVNNFYEYSGFLVKMEYPMNISRINRSLNEIDSINKMYLENSNCKSYISLIPDKNIFASQKSGHLCIDFGKLESIVFSSINFADYISIYDLLKLEDYYKTDQHWAQENIKPVAKKIISTMNSSFDDNDFLFEEIFVKDDFYGTYYGQAQLNVKADRLLYLENEYTKSAVVKSYNTGKEKEACVYNLKKAEGRDPYEMFLEGSDALIKIENPLAKTDKELIVFRDSFASSLVPLMLSGYKKITLVDFRYIKKELLKDYIEFSNQDILFIYSSLVLNN